MDGLGIKPAVIGRRDPPGQVATESGMTNHDN